ncbi:MAG: hypothetical protein FWD06_02510 [Oscillospiraceae bacterium]|nr:hypothetical protein [Oscillospiraceae bacterium]
MKCEIAGGFASNRKVRADLHPPLRLRALTRILCAIMLSFSLLFLLACGVAEPVGADANPPELTETTTEMPTTTEEPTTAEPREWPGVPQAYWAILDEPTHFPSPAHGFALVDVNGDGVLELVMVARQGWGENTWIDPVGLFTQRDGVAYSLAAGGSARFGFRIAADGTIFSENRVNDSMFTGYFSSRRLAPRAVETTLITRTTTFSHWYDDGTVTLWYRNMHDVLREVTEEQYEAIQRRYQPTNLMQFNITWFDEVGA